MSGTRLERCFDEIAMPFRRSASTCGFAVSTLSNSIATWPDMRSGIDSCVPLYGTCASFTPAIDANISLVRCATLPMPLVA